MKTKLHSIVLTMALVTALTGVFASASRADTAAEIDLAVDAAIQKLYRSIPSTKNLAGIAKGILVFPNVIKAGLLVGGQLGEGALRVDGKTIGYYRTVAASYGWQAGAQTFGFALFFMSDDALSYLESSDGWEIGVGPSIVVADQGTAKAMTTTTTKDDIYAFFFDQQGLMAGLGLQGSKITPIVPEP